VAKLLNGTAGVRRVASSRVHKKGFEQAATAATTGGEEGGEGGAAAGGAPPSPEGATGGGATGGSPLEGEAGPMINRLVLRIDGQGSYGAHRLVASFENARGLRTLQLFVSCEKDFSLAQLRDVLRALQPVLNFVLDEGGGMDVVPF